MAQHEFEAGYDGFVAAPAADDGQPGLIVTKAGYWYINVDAAGTPTLVKATRVHVYGVPTSAPVPPTDNPTPPTLDPTATKVLELTKAVGDPAGAQALSILYREVGKAAAAQTLPRITVMTMLKEGTDRVLAALTPGDHKSMWATWRAEVSKMIDAAEAQGQPNWGTFCTSVADGLAASSPAPALDPAILQLIIQLVLQLIQFFTGGGVNGV